MPSLSAIRSSIPTLVQSSARWSTRMANRDRAASEHAESALLITSASPLGNLPDRDTQNETRYNANSQRIERNAYGGAKYNADCDG
uniref:Uncharacterized protein n=1 Tax=Rhodopseudomonas palustris (strain DX-1) TaxID=652103 RepID=E6VPW4_RHOPX